MDDYGAQDSSNFGGDNYESNSYNYGDGNYHGYTHHYDIDKNSDYLPTQESKSPGSSDQNNISNNTYDSSYNDSDVTDVVKQSLSHESQESTPQSETENYKWLDQENFNIDSNNQKDEYQSIINQEPKANDGRFMNENTDSTDDNDCCYCKNEPMMCLAVICECLCL